MSTVQLDALIPREDFEIDEKSSQTSLSQTIKISDLESGSFFYHSLRKPDFQRETSDWSIEKIADFIKSFLDGDLIPAIILWNAGKFTFAIDGAHRLSALISWVNDDYGDSFFSKAFFDHNIPEEQKNIAEKTRNKVNRDIGSYKDHSEAIRNQDKANPIILERAQKLGYIAIQLQWVNGGAEKAEASFFKINQKAVAINSTEIDLLLSRKKPNAIAARAIVRSGTGHKYWSKFNSENQGEIQNLAKEINEILFTPKLKTPVKSIDLPIAGQGYSSRTLSLILDFVNISNDFDSKTVLDDDLDGQSTIKMLKKSKRIAQRILGNHSSSLGLHPAVYFYSITGKHQPTAFLAIVELIKDFETRDFYKKFMQVRFPFENYLLRNKQISNQVTLKYGSGIKGYRQLKEVLKTIIDFFLAGDIDEIVTKKLKDKYIYLNFDNTESYETDSQDFSEGIKSAIFIREAIANSVKCRLCNCMVHKNSISFDHIERVADGGKGMADNGQIAHFYCNSTLKN